MDRYVHSAFLTLTKHLKALFATSLIGPQDKKGSNVLLSLVKKPESFK